MLRRVTSEGPSKIFKFFNPTQKGLQLAQKASKQAKFCMGVCFNFFVGFRGKFPLRSVAKGLMALRRVTPEGSPKIKKNGLFYRGKVPESGLTNLKLGWLTRSIFPVG